jgi:hypothetical protein
LQVAAMMLIIVDPPRMPWTGSAAPCASAAKAVQAMERSAGTLFGQ